MAHTSRVLMNASDPLILYTDDKGNMWSCNTSSRWKREAMRFRLSHDVRASVEIGGHESPSSFMSRVLLPTARKTFYSQNGPLTWSIFSKFYCAQTPGPALGASVPFSNRTRLESPECRSRWTHKGLLRRFGEIKSIRAILLQG